MFKLVRKLVHKLEVSKKKKGGLKVNWELMTLIKFFQSRIQKWKTLNAQTFLFLPSIRKMTQKSSLVSRVSHGLSKKSSRKCNVTTTKRTFWTKFAKSTRSLWNIHRKSLTTLKRKTNPTSQTMSSLNLSFSTLIYRWPCQRILISIGSRGR